MQSTINQGRMQDAILFDTNQQSLKQMNLTQHFNRLDQMSQYLSTAVNGHRASLLNLQQLVKTQINSIKNSYQSLQNQIKEELQRQKVLFEPNIMNQRKMINQMKVQVQKINGEQLTTKKNVLNIQAEVSKMESQIGFIQMQGTH